MQCAASQLYPNVCNTKGFLSSEYEGGEHLRDIGVNSIEQVRRHQEALRAAMEK